MYDPWGTQACIIWLVTVLSGHLNSVSRPSTHIRNLPQSAGSAFHIPRLQAEEKLGNARHNTHTIQNMINWFLVCSEKSQNSNKFAFRSQRSFPPFLARYWFNRIGISWVNGRISDDRFGNTGIISKQSWRNVRIKVRQIPPIGVVLWSDRRRRQFGRINTVWSCLQRDTARVVRGFIDMPLWKLTARNRYPRPRVCGWPLS